MFLQYNLENYIVLKHNHHFNVSLILNQDNILYNEFLSKFFLCSTIIKLDQKNWLIESLDILGGCTFFLLGFFFLRKYSNSQFLTLKWYFVTKIVLTYCEKKLFQWSRIFFFEIYSNSERSEQFLVIECFFNLFLEVSHI